jgi:pimeloyl-ACP methyl ester carboxylesterase
MKVTGRLKQAYASSRMAHEYPDADSRFVNVQGTNLHFVIKGSGRPVVLIHGNPGSCQDWAKLYSSLTQRYCAFAFDRPGHGHSERPNHGGDATVEVQAHLLRSSLDELSVERPILVGHSWGAALAAIYALLYPGDVSGLVLLAPAVYESDDGVSFLTKLPGWPVIGDVLNFLFTPLLGAWLVRTDLAKAFAPDKVPKAYLRHTLAEWTRPRKVKWYSVDDALLNSSLPAFTSRYAELQLPVAIVTGDADQIVPAMENAHRLHKVLPHSTLTVLAQTGHQIPFTQAQAVIDAIEEIAIRAAQTNLAPR